MKSENQFSVLIPDGENLLTIRVIQCLSTWGRAKIFILSSRKYASVRFSRHVTRFIYRQHQSDEAWISSINEIVKEQAIDVIMPVFETAIRKIVAHRDSLTNPEKTLTPHTLRQFETTQDKWLLYQQLKKTGLPCPKTLDLSEVNPNQLDLRSLSFPVLIKPKWEIQGGGKGILKFMEAATLEAYFEKGFEKGPYILQEYFQGVDLGVNVICKQGRILATSIQIGTLFETEDFRPQIGLKMIHEEEVHDSIVRLMEALNYTGVAHIDFLYDPESKKFVVLEINPRYWLTLQASLFAGVNFPELYCKTVAGQPFEKPRYEEIDYFDLKALKTKPGLFLNPRVLWTRTPFKFLVKEPVMTVYHLLWSIKNRLQRKKWVETN